MSTTENEHDYLSKHVLPEAEVHESNISIKNIFSFADGTELEPLQKQTPCIEPDPFLQYNNVVFGIGMDEKIYIKEDGVWRRARDD